MELAMVQVVVSTMLQYWLGILFTMFLVLIPIRYIFR